VVGGKGRSSEADPVFRFTPYVSGSRELAEYDADGRRLFAGVEWPMSDRLLIRIYS